MSISIETMFQQANLSLAAYAEGLVSGITEKPYTDALEKAGMLSSPRWYTRLNRP